jgi:Transglycosylase SLT domain
MSNMKLTFFALLVLVCQPSLCDDSIPPLYKSIAQEHRVPAKLFFAMVLNESRSLSQFKSEKRLLPWPWTINHRGTPYFFPNREDAYVFAVSLLEKGDEQFDIGLGQLNWRWQKQRFRDLWEAFDPTINLSAAAAHLREQFDRPECNSWEKALGCYHRPSQTMSDIKIAENYATRVIKIWQKI